MKPFVAKIKIAPPSQSFAALAALPYSLLLDSADNTHKDGRYSFICAFPLETLEVENGRMTITNREQQTTLECDPFELIQKRMSDWNIGGETLPNLPPFQGGAAGLFGYDLGRMLEELPDDAQKIPNMPDMAIGIYDQVIAFDHKSNKSWIITHAQNEERAALKRAFLLNAIEKGLPSALSNAPQNSPSYTGTELHWEADFTKDEYKASIERVIQYIHEGDIFQANLAQRFEAALPHNFSAYAHYKHMREINPAPMASFMNLGDIKISSTSPERFLSVKDQQVITRPIKGTRPRVKDKYIDQLYRNALENSEKDRAENVMIVDLLRNDLSKTCLPESVHVKDLCAFESFPSVHHLVSTITGTLKKDKSPTDLLRGCFPGGSITGAPKIRAMEIIEELEPVRRGPYCGSIGYIGFDGTMDSNILIRTLVYQNNTVSLSVGGGITISSKPEDEYQETLDKARALFQSFELQETEENKSVTKRHTAAPALAR